jgi:ribose transport system permease protein
MRKIAEGLQTAARGGLRDDDLREVIRRPVRAWLGSSATLVLLVDLTLIVFFSLMSPHHAFWSAVNAEALLRNSAQPLVLALSVTLLMSGGVIDLSIGANLVLSSVVAAMGMRSLDTAGLFPLLVAPLGFAIAIGAGCAFGIVNGLVIAGLRVNSLIATLGTLGVGAGAARLLTDGQDIREVPTLLQSGFAQARLGFMPLPMISALLLAVAVWLLLRFTRFGLRTLAIGSSESAALRAGIALRRHTMGLTALAGCLAGFAGFVDLARYGSTAIASHDEAGLVAVTATVIGGTALAGGRASVFGTICGAALGVILLSGLIIIRVRPFWQLVATGVVLIAAVASDQYRARRLGQH